MFVCDFSASKNSKLAGLLAKIFGGMGKISPNANRMRHVAVGSLSF